MTTNPNAKLPLGKLQQDAHRGHFAAMSSSSGYGEWGLSVARITAVNYEAMKVSIRILSGEDDVYESQPIPITFPFAGQRSILGGMPSRGDFCVVGWAVQESAGRASSRTPVILSWFAAPWWMGHDWFVGQDFSQSEGMDTPLDRAFLEGSSERIRWKLRHMSPGNIIASSGQGSDLVLDESVTLANRRGNEIILRDQDQALVTRSVAQFNVMSGARVYSGPVQRDATFLPTQMFSDGLYWDTPNQISLATGEPVTQDELASHSGLAEFGAFDDTEAAPYPPGYLTPGQIFTRDNPTEDSDFEKSEGVRRIQPSLDPFTFLQWGMFVTNTGQAATDVDSEAVYGGKAYYRLGLDPDDGITKSTFNAAIESDSGELEDMLTEYRVEVTHTSDGTLPVSEQTDGFDADRLPGDTPLNRNPLERSKTSPFVEFVLGSVVGNDPFSEDGRRLYGLPLVPLIFDDDGAPIAGLSSGLGYSLQDHAATLLRVSPPVGDSVPPTFFSITKDGRVKSHIGGPASTAFGAEVYLTSGLKVEAVREINLTAQEGLTLSGGPGVSGYGVDLRSENGAIKIFGGGRATEGSQATRSNPNGNETATPNVLIEGSQNVTLRAGSSVSINAPTLNLENISSLNFSALTSVSTNAGDNISSTTKTRDEVTTGRSTEIFSGPTNALPTNGAVRSVTFAANPVTGFVGGTVDEYFALYGDREETFTFGSHTTQMLVGNLTYETLLGQWRASASFNSLTLNASGLNANITLGNITATAPAGALLVTTSVGATIKTTGPAVLSGAASVTLGAPGKSGFIVSGADLDPLTGIPLVALGLGSPGHLIGPPV